MKNKNFFSNKTILITGGTGSLGQALTKRLLSYPIKKLIIFSRNESKQVAMQSCFSDPRLRYFIGDIRDLPRLIRAFEEVDIVFHTAALKHVPLIEYNPFEAIKTNVMGSQNVLDACLQTDVETAICVGTDKAVSPLNTYGATKLLMEKLFVSADSFINRKKHNKKFITPRYGNVFGSSNSVIPKFIEQITSGQKITITDPNMTRFSIMMDDALDFILESTSCGHGSEVFVPKLKAYTLGDLKDALIELLGNPGIQKMSIRPGEKMHETLINHDEMRYTWEYQNKYIIFNPLKSEKEIKKKYSGIKKLNMKTPYSSDTAPKMTVKELKQILKKSGLIPKEKLIE